MNLSLLRNRGIPLPEIETENGLSAKDIMDQIRSVYRKWGKKRDDYAEAEFLELLYNYPQSMCSRHMTSTLKRLIAIVYFESKLDPKEENPLWNGYSYEDLAIMFNKSKAAIHEAIRQKEAEIKQLLEEAKLLVKAREIALQELVQEEKLKLLEKQPKGIEKTTEQMLPTE